MKRAFIFITILLCLFSYKNVYAVDEADSNNTHQAMELIPIDEIASVETGIFYYNDFKYIVDIPNETYAMLEFSSVTNKTKMEKPLSVSVLLFNEEQKNIGYVAYCSTKDLTGEYAQKKVNPKASSGLTIYVDRNYFIGNYTRSDVKYIAIKDDNDICFIGDSNKYGGLTISEIEEGKLSPDYDEDSIYSYLDFIVNMGIYMFLFLLLIIMSIYTYISIVMYKLNKAMFDRKTKLTFIPFIKTFIATNLAFGRIVLVLHFIVFVAGIYMLFNGNGMVFFLYIFISFVSYIVIIVKYNKKDYNLLFLDPFVVNDGKTPKYAWRKVKVTGQKKAQQVLDLSYNNSAVATMLTEPPVTAPPQVIETQEDILQKLEQQAVAEEQPEGFSDNSEVRKDVDMSVNPANEFLPPELQNAAPDEQVDPKEAKRLEKEKKREEKERLREEKKKMREEKKNKKNEVVEEKSVLEEALEAVDAPIKEEEGIDMTNKEEDMSEFMDMFK